MTVFYVGNFSFPDRDAGGLRVLGVGRALREAGHSVVFVGREKGGRPEDWQSEGHYEYQGFRYVPREPDSPARGERLVQALRTYGTASSTLGRLRALAPAPGDVVVAYQAPAALLWRLLGVCRRNGLGLVADCVEWYDPRHVNGGRLGPFRWDSELRMRWLNPKIGRLFAISSFLEQYYLGHRCAVLRVPPLVDVDAIAKATERVPRVEDGITRLVYFGTPGKKDLLRNAIEGLGQVRTAGLSVELHLVGPLREAISADMGSGSGRLDMLQDAVVFHGRVPHEEALRLVARADFSVLLRADRRYAHAGFPTKLVESLSVGVPVLTNLTSDIGDHVHDGEQGVLLADCSPAAFAAGIRRAADLPRSQRTAMRVHARRAARTFDFRQHADRLNEFVRDARVPS